MFYSNPVFSVITPTFNRAHTLLKCAEGLKSQIFKKFEWIVIDDGSTDNTHELIKNLIFDFNIIYKYQDNKGKASAVDFGISIAKGKYIIILDSDDIPLPNALDTFYNEFMTSNIDICGVASLTSYSNGKIIGTIKSKSPLYATSLNAYSKKKLTGDKWFAFKKNIIEKYKNPVYDNEKFVTEGIVYNRISRDGYIVKFLTKSLLIHDYLDDGLTKNHLYLRSKSPIGFIAYYIENLNSIDVELTTYYFRNAANIIRNSIINSKKPLFVAILFVISFPVGLIIGVYDAYILNKKNK